MKAARPKLVRAERKPASTQAAVPVVRESWKRLSPEQRRAQILEATEQLFTTRPYSELGVQEVARAAGITQGLVYHYFPTKEALLAAAVEQRAQELLRFSLPDTSLSFAEQVEKGVLGYLDYVEAHRVAYLNLFRGPTVAEAEIQRICETTRSTMIEHFLKALGLEALELPVTRLALRGYLGFAESTVLDWLERGAVPRRTLERLLFSAILNAVRTGIGSEAEARMSAADLAQIEAAYRAYFDLP